MTLILLNNLYHILSIFQRGKFNEADKQLGYSSAKYEEFINKFEEKFKQKEL